MSSVASMMSLTSTVSGGSLIEADPGGFLFAPTNNETVTLTADASVSVVTASGSGFLIPTSSNYCIVALGVGGYRSGGYNGQYYHDGGAGGSLAYYNGLTVADGDTFEISTGPSGSTIVRYNGSSNYISIAAANSRTPRTAYGGGTFATATTYIGGQGGGGWIGAGVYKPGHGGDAALFTRDGYGGGTASSSSVNGSGGRGTDLFTGSQTGRSSAGTGGAYGGGAGGRNGYTNNSGPYWNPDPGNGAIRILWGLNRAFPSTNQGNSSSLPNGTADYVHT